MLFFSKDSKEATFYITIVVHYLLYATFCQVLIVFAQFLMIRLSNNIKREISLPLLFLCPILTLIL